jgi:DNA-binding CsgD family transcriptional regulator
VSVAPGHRREADIVRQVYEELLDQERWPRLLSAFTREFDSTYSAILTRDRCTGSVRISAADALEPAWRLAYEEHFARLRPASFFCQEPTVGAVLTDGLYADQDAYLGSELYNEFFRPLRADHLMFTILRRDDRTDESLVVRRGKEAGFYDARAVARLRRLGSHLCNAERLLGKMRAGQLLASNVNDMIDRLGVAAFVTDGSGRIHHMTQTAERILSGGKMFAAPGGRLMAREAAADRQLQAAMRECGASIDEAGTGAWRVLRAGFPKSDGHSMSVSVSAIVWRDGSGVSFAGSLVIVNDPPARRGPSTLQIAGLFGLTRAEASLAAALCTGRSLAAYADSAEISVLTARTLLKRALEKTQTHSQAQLVSLLLRSSALA